MAVGDAVPPIVTYRIAKILTGDSMPGTEIIVKAIMDFEVIAGELRVQILNELIEDFRTALESGKTTKNDSTDYSKSTAENYAKNIKTLYYERERTYTDVNMILKPFLQKEINKRVNGIIKTLVR